jgi:hypothetical protein
VRVRHALEGDDDNGALGWIAFERIRFATPGEVAAAVFLDGAGAAAT